MAAPISINPYGGLLDGQGDGTGTGPLQGGSYIIAAQGTWNSASVQLQYTVDGGTTWVNITGATLSANGALQVDVGQGESLRFDVTGSPTSVAAYLARIA